MERQSFYLVVTLDYGGKMPRKVFLQKTEAVRYGRRLATKSNGTIVELFKQDISRNGVMKFEQALLPFREGEE